MKKYLVLNVPTFIIHAAVVIFMETTTVLIVILNAIYCYRLIVYKYHPTKLYMKNFH